MLEYIKSDFFRYTANSFNILNFIKIYLLVDGFCYSVWFRMSKSKNKTISFLAKIMLIRLSTKFGIFIPSATNIGYGLYIGHSGKIVINPTAKIGNNCNVSHGVTIGSNCGRAAEIGDNVYIGPNTCIVESIVIGSNVTIGAGSVVTKSFGNDLTIAGNPANILSSTANKKQGRYIQRPYRYQ